MGDITHHNLSTFGNPLISRTFWVAPLKSSDEPMVIEPSTLTMEEAKAKQDAFPDEYYDEIILNTLESCKEKYGHFSIEEIGMYANEPRDVDIAVGQPMNRDAGYCMALLLDSGYYSIK